MTVLDHMKAAGYDVAKANEVYGKGTMECGGIDLKVRRIPGTWFQKGKVIVKARAYVKWTDGYEHPFPDSGLWDGHDEACVTAFFDEEEVR